MMSENIPLFPQDRCQVEKLFAEQVNEWELLARSGLDEGERKYRRVFQSDNGIYYTVLLQRPLYRDCDPMERLMSRKQKTCQVRNQLLEEDVLRETACFQDAAIFGFDVGAQFSQVTLYNPVKINYRDGENNLVNNRVVSLLAVSEIKGSFITDIIMDKKIDYDKRQQILKNWTGDALRFAILNQNWDVGVNNTRVTSLDDQMPQVGYFDLEYAGGMYWHQNNASFIMNIGDLYAQMDAETKFRTADFLPLFDETRNMLDRGDPRLDANKTSLYQGRIAKGVELLDRMSGLYR